MDEIIVGSGSDGCEWVLGRSRMSKVSSLLLSFSLWKLNTAFPSYAHQENKTARLRTTCCSCRKTTKFSYVYLLFYRLACRQLRYRCDFPICQLNGTKYDPYLPSCQIHAANIGPKSPGPRVWKSQRPGWRDRERERERGMYLTDYLYFLVELCTVQ